MTKSFLYIKTLLFVVSLSLILSISLGRLSAHAGLLDDFVHGALKTVTHDNHKLRTSLNGHFNFDNTYFPIEADYQMIVNSQVDNRCGLACKASHEILFHLKLNVEDNVDIDGIHLTLNLSALSYDQGKNLYFRVNDLKVSFLGSSESIQEEMEAGLEKLEQWKKNMAHQWLHLNEAAFKDIAEEGFHTFSFSLNDTLAQTLSNNMETIENKSGGQLLMELMQGVVDEMQAHEELDPEEAQKVMKIVQALIDNKWFFTFEVNTGHNVGFKRFILNRFLLANVLEDHMKDMMEETLSAHERQEFLDFISGLRLAVWYRFNEADLIDVLSAYFSFSEKDDYHFEARYRQQLWGQNQAKVRLAPSQSLSWDKWMESFNEL